MGSTGEPTGTAQPSSPAAPSLGHHSNAEVLAAYLALSKSDIGRLMAYARFRTFSVRGRFHHADAGDLFHEALVRTLDATRPWRKGVTFINHLVGCMRSIVNNWSEKASRFTELSDTPAPSPSMESAIDAQSHIDRLRGLLSKNRLALSILDAWLDGY